MNTRENEEFTNHLKQAVREAERLKYSPHRFKSMLDANGGFDTVKRILESGKPSDGFVKLWELGRLDLTCEAIVVETKWRQYFDTGLISRSEGRLKEARYPFKAYTGPSGEQVAQDSAEAAGQQSSSDRDVARDESVIVRALGINAFFKEVLHAPVSNPRWSWGSVDERMRRVYLRVWREDVSELDGVQVIRVLGDKNAYRPGWKERANHVDLIKRGYEAYGVVCDKKKSDLGGIASFDHRTLFKLDGALETAGVVVMRIADSIPVESIGSGVRPSIDLEKDVKELEGVESETTRSALVDARLGQGRYRRELLRRWDGACAVTGCKVRAVLRASHCKPWRKSDNRERLDSSNGLILTANLDGLFDAGLISFDDSGEMLIGSALGDHERRELGLPAELRRQPGPKLAAYLRYHREHVFRA